MIDSKKQVWLMVAIVSFLLSWLIDRLGGPVSIAIDSPIAFLTSPVLLHKYPFTAAAIIIRTLFLFVSSMLVISLIPKRYFAKALILLFVGILAEFFAIQQLATGSHVTTIQWTLSIAYASPTLIFGIVWTILKGVWSLFNKQAAKSEQSKEDSVLEPQKEEKDK